jgi:hypothetical protein
MTKDQIYRIWRPDDSPWSRWVKPVLFSYMVEEELPPPGTLRRKWEVPHSSDTAIIVNMPGEEGVAVGLALSEAGYRPIPVYNACPYATYDPLSDEIPWISNPKRVDTLALVDVVPIMSAIARFALELEAAQLPPTALPAFLVNENRQSGWSVSSGVEWFDNRSFITSADFPSAKFFKEHGASRIVVIQTKRKFRTDLLQVLLEWQAGGLIIAEQEAWQRWDPRDLTVKPPSLIPLLWHRLQAKFGYRRNLSGSFGQLVRPSGG